MRQRTVFSIMLVVASSIIMELKDLMAAPDQGGTSVASTAHFQFSVFNPVQLVDEKENVAGLRLTLLYGKNADISGIDLGLGITHSKNITGIQIGGIGNGTGLAGPDSGHYTVKGIQIAGLFNLADNDTVNGIQIAGLGNASDYLNGIQIGGFGNGVTNDAAGMQIGFANDVGGKMNGIQVGIFNNFPFRPRTETVTGIQIGVFNYAAHMAGVQIGIINACKTLRGVQIGLLNHIEEGRFPYLPIINAQF